MTKQYISILELIPKLIENNPDDHRGMLFTYNNNQNPYYKVNEAKTKDKKQLTFSNLDETIDYIAEEEASKRGSTHHIYSTYDKKEHAPYIMGESYEVPHILEVEYLKQSVYKDILDNEYLSYIENILYLYLLYYDRVIKFEQERTTNMFYTNYNEESELYQSIQPFIRTMDNKDKDFKKKVNKVILNNYKALDKLKKPTKTKMKFNSKRMYASRNLSELLEISHIRPVRYSAEPAQITQAEHISQPIPLLMLYSLLAQETKEHHYPSYRLYLRDFEKYPTELKGPMRKSYTLEEYIEERLDLGANREYVEKQVYVYTYGNMPRRTNMYTSEHDRRMNSFLFPHIMNQIRLAGFESTDRMIVPQGLMNSFENEPWHNFVKPETIVYNSKINWGEEDE